MEDREKLRAKAAAERKMAKVQQQLDKLASEAERMASMGLSMEEIQKVGGEGTGGWGDDEGWGEYGG